MLERIRNIEHLPSRAAIVAILGGVAVYECICPEGEFISEELDRIMESKIGRIAVNAIVWTTAAHLTNVMPERIDWIHGLSQLKSKE